MYITYILKRYENFKWKRNHKYLSRILLKAKAEEDFWHFFFLVILFSSTSFMQCYARCKIEFHV